MTALELTGTIDEDCQLKLDTKLPIPGPKRVRVIVFTRLWMSGTKMNGYVQPRATLPSIF
ncbi:MAG: hypothetical protein KKC71_04300 [Chloroflexi bacterium]|nr:hypothetical protein [Chloroflexota bacterium]